MQAIREAAEVWEEIRLRSLGVIADAELELGPGLTVVTGETGAGKTMVVTALGLLRGGRSDAALVRHGDRQSRVEARVRLHDLPAVAELVDEAAGEIEDGIVILGRTVSREGRSRAYVGGASVPASVLAAISDRLVAVHGQSDQHRLLQSGAQLAALDKHAGRDVADLLERYRPALDRLRECEESLSELVGAARERARELDLLTYGLQEIETVSPAAGEDAELLAEEGWLAHAEALLDAAEQSRALLAGTDGDDYAADAVSTVARARSAVADARRHDSRLDALGVRLDELGFLASDLAADVASYASSVEVDPARLAAVQDRRAALATLTRKYGPSLDDVLTWAEQAARRSVELTGDDDRIGGLRHERDALVADLTALAGGLTAARRQSAADLATRVTAELADLAMPHARIGVEVTAPDGAGRDALGPDGVDRVEVILAANPGAPARPLAKSASGGELSRVMLALEVVLADQRSVPTFVFDEVDAGIGGRAAVEVGRRLARLARGAQVLAVTHLPQVAAFADRHYLVVKSDDGSVTTSGVEALDDAGRVAELSRMLAGLEDSASAHAHAEELLALAAADRG